MVDEKYTELKPNQEFKSYKELCIFLEEKVKSSNSKNAQLKEWGRYFSFKKDGYKIIIKEVYKEPKEKLFKTGNNQIYIKYIEALLLNILSQNKELTCTKKELFILLGMANSNYRDKSKEQLFLEDNEEISKYDMYDFNKRSYGILNGILKRSLDSLKKQFILDWVEEIHYKINGKEGISTIKQKEEFDSIVFNTLREMSIEDDSPNKYKTIIDIFFYNKQEHFYSLLNKNIKDKLGWDYYSTKLHLIYKQEDVKIAIARTQEELLQLENKYNENKIELNTKVLFSINKNAQTKYKNYMDKVNNIDGFVYISNNYKENYVINQENISNFMIKL